MSLETEPHSSAQSDLPVVLIISPHFPPSTLAGVHRARHLAKHLPAHGWQPVIIRADERHYTEAPDPELAALLPEDIIQIRTGAWSAKWTRKLGIGDIGIRAYSRIKTAICDAVVKYNPRAILITGSPFYPMLMTSWIKANFDLPVVLDFQDPWINGTGGSRPYFSKGRMAHRLSVALEPKAVREADWVTSVSALQNEQMAARYPHFSVDRMSAIPIGGDPEDYDALRSSPPQNTPVKLPEGTFNLCYVGTFLPRATRVAEALFEAVSTLVQHTPSLREKLRLVFVGTSNQPPGLGARAPKHLIKPIADAAGLGGMVVEHPERVPFLNALSLLANADAIMMIGSDEPHYTASKIYPGLMSGTPFLSLFHEQSSSHQILSNAGGGLAHGFSDIDQIGDLQSALIESLTTLMRPGIDLGKPNPSSYANYTADSVSQAFADVFRSCAT
ncbi:MAG: glycosyltransferase [Pseudomonadota bacterium]